MQRNEGVGMLTGMLDQKATKMLEALERCGSGWHSRAEIAEALNKQRLTDADVLALDYLIKEGLIEAERHEIDAPIPVRWEYRIKGQ
jgi:hypothetical protein